MSREPIKMDERAINVISIGRIFFSLYLAAGEAILSKISFPGYALTGGTMEERAFSSSAFIRLSRWALVYILPDEMSEGFLFFFFFFYSLA